MYLASEEVIKQKNINRHMRNYRLFFLLISLFLFLSCNGNDNKEDTPIVKKKEVLGYLFRGWISLWPFYYYK